MPDALIQALTRATSTFLHSSALHAKGGLTFASIYRIPATVSTEPGSGGRAACRHCQHAPALWLHGRT